MSRSAAGALADVGAILSRGGARLLRRSGVVFFAVLSLAALGLQGAGLAAEGGLRLWAVNLAWTLAGLAASTGTLAAALAVEKGARVARAWRLWALASAFWLAGAAIRDVQAHPALSPAADACWLLFALCCIAGVSFQTPPGFLFRLFLLDSLPVVLLVAAGARIASGIPSIAI